MNYKDKLAEVFLKLNNPQSLAIIYLIPFGYLVVENPLWLENIYIAAPVFLSSIALLTSVYIGYRDLLNKVFNNTVVKWGVTGFTYSVCLWIAKFKLNIAYGIDPENLNYSTLAYAFMLSFPIGAMICAIVVYIYIFLRDVSPAKIVISSILSVYIEGLAQHYIQMNNLAEKIIIIGLIIMVPYNIVNLASSLFFRKNFNFNRLISGLSLFAVSVALFIISMTAMKYVERFQEKFIFLDTRISTTCGNSENQALYIEKNDSQCYKVSGNKFSDLRLTLVDKNSSNINNKGTSIYEQ
ncbi:TPA: hypothetical protein ACOM1H_003185 [Escherichia coli]|uniref:hypothetical protein n=1 Tax=Escherichia coli TaxID=562 RepID=UPI000DA498FE|nr:hypothetical protein [Escherichia coli]MCY6888569.1 hypothetical protein [Escherichia coli]SSA06806.1 Uncharacterised protein [Escherichia coli]GMM25542.1 hypothetical protein KTU0001_29650 [Escherichia coli]HBE4412316.1 hypothetical protein [Escherichia coli]HBE6338970.1 hypothetical protein [Escherichia coli]